jgi:hypothetical protein
MPSTASVADLRFIGQSIPSNGVWYLDDVQASCGTGQPPNNPPPGDAGRWLFEETGSPPTAFDATAHHNDGTNYNIVGGGGGYTFNGTNSRVIVHDDDSLDPVGANFTFGVRFSMSQGPATGETYDVLRKGITTTAGGDYKLEVSNSGGLAVARCIVKDNQKVAAIIKAGNIDLAGNGIHTVECQRSGNSVSIVIDATPRGTATVAALGTISNAADLAVGAKAEGTAQSGFDWFLGTVFEAWVTIN